MRRCRLKSCRKELPPLAEADGWPKAGFCDGNCRIEHERQKAESRKPMARKPIARKTAPKKRSRPKKKYGWRSEPYLRWVRSQPCVYCGRSPAGEAHHLIGVGSGLSGMGLTAPDQYVMPLCRRHHEQIHRDPDLLQHQWQWVAQTLARAVEEEVVTLVA